MNDAAPTPKTQRRWTSIPAARSSAPILKYRLWLVLGFLILSSLGGLFSGFASLTEEPVVVPPAPAVPVATGFATEVASAWLAGRPITLPVGTGVDATFGGQRQARAALGETGVLAWNGFKVLTPVPGRVVEIHTFVVGGTPPRQLQVTVELTDAGPVLAAAPTFGPLPLAVAPETRYDYTDQKSAVRLTDAVERLGDEWVKAYSADDRARLRELTGDDQPRVYPGLGAFTPTDVNVVSAIPAVADGPADGMWVVRVSATLTNTAGFVGTNEWDLLVSSPATANPRVVAWGPAGLGLYLTPFENGLAGGDSSGAGLVTTTTAGLREVAPADETTAPPAGG